MVCGGHGHALVRPRVGYVITAQCSHFRVSWGAGGAVPSLRIVISSMHHGNIQPSRQPRQPLHVSNASTSKITSSLGPTTNPHVPATPLLLFASHPSSPHPHVRQPPPLLRHNGHQQKLVATTPLAFSATRHKSLSPFLRIPRNNGVQSRSTSGSLLCSHVPRHVRPLDSVGASCAGVQKGVYIARIGAAV